MNDRTTFERVMDITAQLESLGDVDRLEVLEIAWLVMAANARNAALALPGGFPAEQARQLTHLEKIALLVREDSPDLEGERLFLEGDIAGMLRHMRARIDAAEANGEEGREYYNLSDFLSDHAEQIRAHYRGAPPGGYLPDYTEYAPEIDLLLDIMDAVRGLPGLDRVPEAASAFDADLAQAVAKYRLSRGQATERP
ncbi:MAG TPA: hypothetical protein VGD94_09025 [Vicinamibacterales bacterium]